MEEIPLSEAGNFDTENSLIHGAYHLLGVKTPSELSNKYTELDQQLMHSREWDYKNTALLTNQVKEIIEEQYEELSGEEREWAQEILWFWYHHAISCAIGRYADKTAAQMFSAKALKVQPIDHPNKITRLLYLIVHDRLKEAEVWGDTITEEPEKSTAQDLLELHKTKGLFQNF